MTGFVARRLAYGFLVLFGVITVLFLLFNILPGDPARMMLGQRSDIASVEAIEKDLGLHRPLLVQYANLLNDLSPLSWYSTTKQEGYWFLDTEKYSPLLELIHTGNGGVIVLKKPYMRRSYQSQREVTDIVTSAFPNTAILAITAMAIAIVLGLGLGILSALHPNSWIDRTAMVFSVLGMSVPSFFAAILFGWIFAFVLADYTGLNMFGSLYSVDDLGRGQYLELKNLILPAITLGVRPLAVLSGLMRNSMLEVLSQDYIRTAYAKGLSRNRVVYRHALRNALNPVITSASGWLASLFSGAVFVEYVFDWKGLGSVMVDALEKYDFPVIMGAVLFISVILILINLITDIAYGWLDPRIRST